MSNDIYNYFKGINPKLMYYWMCQVCEPGCELSCQGVPKFGCPNNAEWRLQPIISTGEIRVSDRWFEHNEVGYKRFSISISELEAGEWKKIIDKLCKELDCFEVRKGTYIYRTMKGLSFFAFKDSKIVGKVTADNWEKIKVVCNYTDECLIGEEQ